MADNTQISLETTGDVIATDDIGGVKYQRMKVTLGADGENDGDVSSSNPMPVSGTVTIANPTANPETGLATSAKQDTLLTELQKKADLTETQPVDTGEALEFIFRSLLAAIRDPVWLDMATNANRALLVSGSTTAVTGSLTTAGTVSTVTDITNFGGNPAYLVAVHTDDTAWAMTTRNLLI